MFSESGMDMRFGKGTALNSVGMLREILDYPISYQFHITPPF
jgi:hypothetical protein